MSDLVIDADGATTYANPKMAEILGTTPDGMLSRPLLDFVTGSDRDETIILRHPFE